VRSMTGFGVGEAPLGRGRLVVELRATNHRFLDVRVRLPHALADLAAFAEATLRERLSRGRFDLSAHLDGAALQPPVLDKERARAAFKALTELRDELAPNQEVPLSLLASVPGIFAPALDGLLAVAQAAVRDATIAALAATDTMRATEGATLARDLGTRLDRIQTALLGVAARAPEGVATHRRRLQERIERLGLTGELGADGARVAQEIALFAERVDVTEELTRLGSHIDQATALLAREEPVGRRLDFLLQEMNRESNTIGAKSPDTAVSHAIVEIKAEIERMREQVQNVE
jgi:uncharacterized protein (TIGR00255 family)